MLQILPFHSHSIVGHEEDQLSVPGRQRELHPVRMAVDNHILYEVIQNPQIGVRVKTYPERLFGDVNLIVDPLFLQNRDPVDEDVPRQFGSIDYVHCQNKFIGIQLEPVEQDIDVFLQVIGLPAGGLDGIVFLPSGHKPPVGGVKISDQCGQRSPHVMGKAGHKLPVGSLRPAECGQLFFIRGNDVVDFIGDGRGEFIRRGQNTAAAVSGFDIRQRVKHFIQPRFYPPDHKNTDQDGSGGNQD